MYALSFTHVFQTIFSKEHVFFFMQNSRKPGICISYSSKRSSALYWLHNDSLYAKGFYCSMYLCDNSHICCLWPEKDPIWFWGTKEIIKLAAWILHRFSAMKLNHSLWYDDAANDMKITFLIVWSKILDGRSYFNIKLCTLHTQTIQTSQLDWQYFLHCGNDFWRIYTYFGVKIWPVKVKLRV